MSSPFLHQLRLNSQRRLNAGTSMMFLVCAHMMRAKPELCAAILRRCVHEIDVDDMSKSKVCRVIKFAVRVDWLSSVGRRLQGSVAVRVVYDRFGPQRCSEDGSREGVAPNVLEHQLLGGWRSLVHVSCLLSKIEVMTWVICDLECLWGQPGIESVNVGDIDGVVQYDDAVFVQKGSSFGDDIGSRFA